MEGWNIRREQRTGGGWVVCEESGQGVAWVVCGGQVCQVNRYVVEPLTTALWRGEDDQTGSGSA